MGRSTADDLQKATANYDEPPYCASPNPQKAIIALPSHQLVCYRCIDRSRRWRWHWAASLLHQSCFKRYRNSLPKGKKGMPGYCVCCAKAIRHYFLAYEVWLMTKSHAIKALLRQPILSSRISQWLLQLSQYNLKAGMPKTVKSQTIADLLAQFPREEEFPLDDEVPGEVAMAEKARVQWVMKFDGFFIT